MSVELAVVDPEGTPQGVLPLPHGGDLDEQLAAAGWRRTGLVDAVRAEDAVRIVVAAEPTGPAPGAGAAPTSAPQRTVARDADLEIADGEQAHPHQRIAAYALITDGPRILLTRLSARVRGAAGAWTFPGGGLDPGEAPRAGLVREVWEETGHDITEARLTDVDTAHWLGRSPEGRLEDFHAVRLIYLAEIERSLEPVIHDVGGSTAEARWVPRDEVADLVVVPALARSLEDIGWGSPDREPGTAP